MSSKGESGGGEEQRGVMLEITQAAEREGVGGKLMQTVSGQSIFPYLTSEKDPFSVF